MIPHLNNCICSFVVLFLFNARAGNFELIHRVQLLQDALGKAILISKEATSRIEEFQVQLSILQRQCSTRDRPLCDTLRLRSFEDNGLLNILTRVRNTRRTRFDDPFTSSFFFPPYFFRFLCLNICQKNGHFFAEKKKMSDAINISYT